MIPTRFAKPNPSRPRHWLLFAVVLTAILLLTAGCTRARQLGARPEGDLIAAVETYLQRYQPGPEPRLFQTTRIYDRRDRLIAELWEEGRRTWVPLDRISQHLIDATVATEDASFYVNQGVDPRRIAGAALRNVREGEIVSGASTITMQLARNLFLGPDQRYDQNMDRKLLEAGLAQELTDLFSKDELLEMYLNLLNYGHLAYGPEAAAQVYFGKPAAELSLAEATLLAGIPQRPADLDPLRNFEAARARQRVVLNLMVRHGYLSQEEADAVFAEPLTFNPEPDRHINLAPHFMQWLEEELEARLGEGAVRRSGMQIVTTLDLDMQRLAQEIVAGRVAELQPKYDLSNAAVVAMLPTTGEILAMVGSADFDNPAIAGQVNVAISPRQPGSAIKPILYATALDQQLISPATVLWDIPVTYTISAGNVYTPTNYDGRFHGPVTVRSALANSYNVPAVKLLDALGVDRMLQSAQAMGLHSLSQDRNWYGLSLTLGGGEVTLLDLTTAYAVLASQGQAVQPRPVLALRDGRGRIVDAYGPLETTQVLSPATAFLISDILSDNQARTPAFGPNSLLRLGRPAAVKTGTTSDWRDNWTMGYTRYLVTGVWAGNSDGHPMRNTSGLTGAAPIWHDFMEAVLADPMLLASLEAPEDPAAWQFTAPADVVRWQGSDSELRPACPSGLWCREGGEYFSQAWLDAVGEAGPLADSMTLVASAPVYVDRGEGRQWTGYCQTEPAAARPLLRLPGRFGPLQAITSEPAEQSDQPWSLVQKNRREQLQAVAWVLRHPTPVDLGPCEALSELTSQAMALVEQDGETTTQVLVDLAAAMDPNAGPIGGSTAVPVASIGPGSSAAGRYFLAQPISHHNACPGNYIIGLVLNQQSAPVAGVHIALVDQWGNQAHAVSKSGASDYGAYDFPINNFANRYTLTVVDEAGNPLSPPVIVEHLQGSGRDAPCHTVVWRGG